MCASALQDERLVSGVYSRIVRVIVSQTAVVKVIVGMLVIASVIQIKGFVDGTFPKDSRQHVS
jgi:multidrug efflux pump subunit AcrB